MRFSQFIQEETFLDEELLLEAKDDPSKVGGASNDTKGVLHELLVGRFLNEGEHLALHPNIERETPKQAHDRLKRQIHPKDYARIVKRAQSAANDIRSRLEETHPGHKVTGVYWTSKKGDTEKVTGVKATQTEDASDIYVTTEHKKHGVKHHGISLKVTDKSSKNVPSSSLGAEHSGSRAKDLLTEHQKRIKEMFPQLTKVKKTEKHKNIAAARKEWATANPKKHKKIKEMNRELLRSVAHHHAAELQQMINDGKHEEVLDHIRTLLGAKTTPAQKSGKATYQRHTSYETSKGTQHYSIDPSTHYESLLKNPKNIEVDSSGANVHFYIRHPKTGERIKIASQAHKFDSQSDPLSNLKSAGKSTVSDEMLKENFEETFQNILLEGRSNKEKIMAAAERAAAVFNTTQKNRQMSQERKMTNIKSENESAARKQDDQNRAYSTAKKEAAVKQTETDLSWADYREDPQRPVLRGVTGAKVVSQLAKRANLAEEVPANAMGTAGISGLDTAVNVGIAGRDMLLTPEPLRRPPPKMFGGKRVFTVPSKDYYKATLGRKKGQHWRSMVNGPLGEEIRQYALENKEAPIIVEDETTGAMMYLRYGKR